MTLSLIDYILLFVMYLLGPVIKEFLISLIARAPERKHEQDLTGMQNEHSKELQIESYFREISGKKLEETLEGWTDVLMDVESIEKKGKRQLENHFKKLSRDTVMLGSKTTCNLLAGWFRFLYINQTNEKKATRNINSNRNNDYNSYSVIFVACIIVSLKKDFTGILIDPLDILKIKISDYGVLVPEERYIEIKDEIFEKYFEKYIEN